MSRLLRDVFILVVALGMAGCAAPINQYNAARYYDLGLENEFAGNYEAARDSFQRALVNAELGGAPPSYISAVLYNLGRMHGYTCDFDSAEQLLVEALAAERSLKEPDPANITKRLSELARLSFDLGKYEQSANYYNEVIPLLEQLGIRSVDPIGYAYFLDGSAEAFRRAGDPALASQQAEIAMRLRVKNEGTRAQFIPVEYHDICTSDGAL